MVKEDSAMQDLTEEQEKELRDEVIAIREQKKLGARPTNHAASQDYRCQLEALNDQVSSIYKHCYLSGRSRHFQCGQVQLRYASSAVDNFKTLSSPTGSAPRMLRGSRTTSLIKICGM